MSWFKRFKPFSYSIILHNTEYRFKRKDNWKECVAWCVNTFDKNNYSCDIKMNGNNVYEVVVWFRQKEDYTQFILTWCE